MKRKTKIVCTVGPAIDNPEMIEKMIDAGMNVARLNYSHADQEEHGRRIVMIRDIAQRKNVLSVSWQILKVRKLELGNLKMISLHLRKVIALKFIKNLF